MSDRQRPSADDARQTGRKRKRSSSAASGLAIHEIETAWLDFFAPINRDSNIRRLYWEDAKNIVESAKTLWKRGGVAVYPHEGQVNGPWDWELQNARSTIQDFEKSALKKAWEFFVDAERKANGSDAGRKARERFETAMSLLRDGHADWPPARLAVPPLTQPPTVQAPSSEAPSVGIPPLQAPKDQSQAAVNPGFGGDETGLGGYWNSVKVLGKGGFGQAALWLRYDRYGNVVDVRPCSSHRIIVCI